MKRQKLLAAIVALTMAVTLVPASPLTVNAAASPATGTQPYSLQNDDSTNFANFTISINSVNTTAEIEREGEYYTSNIQIPYEKGDGVIPEVTIKDGNTTLTKGTHYDVSADNVDKVGGDGKNEWSPCLNIVFKNSYAGKPSLHIRYTIIPKDISKAEITTLDNYNGETVYTGKPFDPVTNVTVMNNAGTAPYDVPKYDSNNKSGYVITGNNVDVGEKKSIQIEGKGNFSGIAPTPALELTIYPRKLLKSDITIDAKKIAWDNGNGSPSTTFEKVKNAITVTNTLVTDSKTGKAGVTIPWSELNNPSKWEVKWYDPLGKEISNVGDTDTIKNPGTYKVRISPANKDNEKSFAAGNFYGTEVIEGEFTVGDLADIDIIADVAQQGINTTVNSYSDDYVYNGKDHFTDVKNAIDSAVKSSHLTENLSDSYEVQDVEIIDAKTYEITLNGIKSLKGTKATVKVTISRRDITTRTGLTDNVTATQGVHINPTTDAVIENSAAKVMIVGKDSGGYNVYQVIKNLPMVENEDYTVKTVHADKNGFALEVVVEGIGNYTGKITLSPVEKENKLNLSDSTVTASFKAPYKYTGQKAKLQSKDVTLTINGKEISSDYYTVTDPYADANPTAHVKPGVYSAVITMIKNDQNYYGYTTAKYTIEGFTLSEYYKIDDIEDLVYAGKALDIPEVKVTNQVNGVALVKGTKNDENDYTVKCYDPDGVEVTKITKQGTYRIVVTLNDRVVKNQQYTGSRTLEASFNVVGQNIKSLATVTLDDSKCVYDGTEQHPDVTVALKDGTKLVEGTDYELGYKDAVDVTAASVVIVKGIGAYGEKIEVSFNIAPADLANVNTKISAKNPTYNGTVRTPSMTVKTDIETLKLNKDYTVSSVTQSAKIGQKSVTIAGKGNYTGTKSAKFAVIPAKAVIKTTTAGTDKVTVKIKAQTGAKYQIKYRLNGKKHAGDWTTVNASSATKTIKKLQTGKKYRIQARGYVTVDGKKLTGTWSDVRISKKIK